MGAATPTLIDTYALMAEATGEIPKTARTALDAIRREKGRGVIHSLITYEFLLQYYRQRLPAFKSAPEARDFLNTYFSLENLTNESARTAAEIKMKSLAAVRKLKRHLSACDALTIAVAKLKRYEILSGDRDLTVVARNEGVRVNW